MGQDIEKVATEKVPEEVEETTVQSTGEGETKKVGGLWLFITIFIVLALILGGIKYAWDNGLSVWWAFQCPQWIKVVINWTVLLSLTKYFYDVAVKVLSEEDN